MEDGGSHSASLNLRPSTPESFAPALARVPGDADRSAGLQEAAGSRASMGRRFAPQPATARVRCGNAPRESSTNIRAVAKRSSQVAGVEGPVIRRRAGETSLLRKRTSTVTGSIRPTVRTAVPFVRLLTRLAATPDRAPGMFEGQRLRPLLFAAGVFAFLTLSCPLPGAESPAREADVRNLR